MESITGSSSMTSESRAPIFVLGCQRSGTSLMRRILDSHSNIACPPESGFIVQLSGVYEIERSIKCLETMGFSKADVLEQMRIFAAHFFEEYATAKGKGRWADKTPHYLNHVDTIDLMFKGEPLYIGIVRHGLDVAYSLCGFNWGVLKPYLAGGTEKPIAAIRFWRDQNTKLLNFRDKVKDRFYLVRYEDLTSQPRPILMSLIQFLDQPWEEAVLNYSTFEHDPGFEDPKISSYDKIEPHSGDYKNWSFDLQRRVYQEAQILLERFNYTP